MSCKKSKDIDLLCTQVVEEPYTRQVEVVLFTKFPFLVFYGC